MKTRSKKKKFQYQPRSKDQVQKRAQQQGGQYDTAYKDAFKTWNPKPGDHRIRILPPTWPDAEHYGIDVWLHSDIGPDNQSYICAEKTGGNPCCICAEAKRARREGQGEYADKLQPYRRVLLWVVVRGGDDDGPVLYPMPWTMDRDISNISIDKSTGEILCPDDPEEGFDVEFTRTGSGMKTKYTGVAIARRSSPLSDDEDEMEEWLNYISENPLPSTLNHYPQEHIKAVFEAAPADDDDDDDDGDQEEAPVRKSKRKVVEEDDDDDDDDDEPPVRKRKKRVVEEEDDDEEGEDPEDDAIDDDEEELDEPTPRKGKKGADTAADRKGKKNSRRAAVSDDDEEDDDEPPTRKRKVVAEEDDDDEEEDEKPTLTKKIKSSMKAAAVADDDDEEDDEDDDEPPVRKSKRKVVEEDDEDDDDDEEESPKKSKKRVVEEDDDDDDDEPPVRKRKRKVVEEDDDEEDDDED